MIKKYYLQTVLMGLAIILSSSLAKAADYRVSVGSCDAGGAYRSSTSYRLHDAIGQAVIGNWQSTNHKLAANLYPALTSAQITLVSPNSGTVGRVISVQGAYFNPTESVRIDLEPQKPLPYALQTVEAFLPLHLPLIVSRRQPIPSPPPACKVGL